MTETTEAAVATHSTIKQYRDEARQGLSTAYKTAGKYSDEVAEATGAVRATLKGKVGFSKDEQINALTVALTQINDALVKAANIDPQAVAQKVAQDKDEAFGALSDAKAALENALALASERDFDTYLAEKNAAKEAQYASYEDDEFDGEDDDDY